MTRFPSVPLKFLCAAPPAYGSNVASESYVDAESGVRFLRTTDIGDDGSVRPEVDGVFVSHADAREALLRDRDVLFSRSGTIGRSLLYREALHGRCAHAGYLVRFRPSPRLESRWLVYFSKSSLFQDQIAADVVESTIANFNGQKFANLDVPAPAASTQRAIADFLDRKTAAIDELIRKKERLIELLEEKRQALITQAVTKGLDPNVPMKESGVEWIGEVPAHWDIRPVWQIFGLGRGVVTSHEYVANHPGPYPLYSSQTADDGVMGWIDSFMFDGDYLTWTTDGANAGTVFRRSGRFNCTNVCGTLRPRGSVDCDYMVHAVGHCVSAFVRYDINPKLMNAVMARIRIPVPPYKEQIEIATRLAPIRKGVTSATSRLCDSISRLREYRQALITAAVTGQLDIPAEPAA